MKEDFATEGSVGRELRVMLGNLTEETAASRLGITKEELEQIFSGESKMSKEVARRARELFGTGGSPWLEMIEEAEKSGK